MGNLQIKDIDPSLHAALRDRAAAERLTMRDYVLRLIEHDLARPTMREWLDELASEPLVDSDIDVVALIREDREDRTDLIVQSAEGSGSYADGS